jgi:hypothetical protein
MIQYLDSSCYRFGSLIVVVAPYLLPYSLSWQDGNETDAKHRNQCVSYGFAANLATALLLAGEEGQF